jgi:glycosyltransferase involved in cell wall biosynthesis
MVNEHFDNLGVCIPCHLKNEEDLNLLFRALESIRCQSQKPREVVIADDSPETLDKLRVIENFPELNIQVIRNSSSQGIANNTNFGVSFLTTDWIHVLHQDDWLSKPSSYEEIFNKISEFDSQHKWFLVSGIHEDGSIVIPIWNKSNLLGFNSIGGPSCLIIQRTNYIQYDQRFRMMVDVKNYSDYFNAFGKPGVVNNPLISYGNPPTRVSRNITLDETLREIECVLKEETIGDAELIECLQNSSLNPYNRMLVLKLATKSMRIQRVVFIRIFISLLIARIKLKYLKPSQQ